ncbi:UDP-N-acetylmuramate dehydrogenase [bacterium]|nr:UDP-N-acetylmuramate dehydrogenase [bacterium]
MKNTVHVIRDIQTFFKGRLFENELLKTHTWYQIGGPCSIYAIPETTDDLTQLVRYCRSNAMPVFILGKGSNLLVSDSGISGIVVDLSECCSFTNFDETRVTTGAGVQVPKLVLDCEKKGLGGIEMFAGIPGTVGGAIKMNAGCHGKEFFDVTVSVDLLDNETMTTLPKSKIEYSYRHVKTLDDPARIILAATLQLEKTDIMALTEKRKHFMKIRQQTQPINLPSSGSVFKNPPGDHAARLIDVCGLKGYRIGGAAVSEKHANFFVNEGNAQAKDVLEIIRYVQSVVVKQFGIKLELEVKLVGFTSEELHSVGLA